MGSPLRAVVVGCGIIGHTHAEELAAQDRTVVAALVDPVETNRTELAAKLQTWGQPEPAHFADLPAALDGCEADLVAVCTPSGLHAELGSLALRNKKHLIVEKPLDVDLPRARKLAEEATAAKGHGVTATVISQHRFDPASRAVHAAITEGRLGRITSAVASIAWWRSDDYYASGAWRGTWAQDGGGALMNQGVHTVDLLLWFLGRPVTVAAHTARLAHHDIEVEDTAAATIVFESGAMAVLHATTAAFPGDRTRIGVYGDSGSAELQDDQLGYFRSTTGDEPPQPPGRAGHPGQYDDILRAIDDGDRPAVGLEDAVQALALVRSVYVSAALGREVRYDEVLAGRYDDIDVRR